MTIDPISALQTAADSKDPKKLLTALTDFDLATRDVENGVNYVAWLSNPVNITSLHRNLMNNFSVQPRLLAIRRGNYTRTRRAVLMLHAMINAIRRTHNL